MDFNFFSGHRPKVKRSYNYSWHWLWAGKMEKLLVRVNTVEFQMQILLNFKNVTKAIMLPSIKIIHIENILEQVKGPSISRV